MTWREIDAENLSTLRKTIIVDVRSPCEHSAERIPNSINIPLLTDLERAEVGTAYAQQGEVVARRLGLKLISPKIPLIVDQIVALKEKDTSLVVHCWRGGLRSEAVASFLTIVGIDCWRLKGGYKAWRRYVLDGFTQDQFLFTPVILHGRTGTGKTEILCELENLGAHTLDLEALSEHRGSLFGAIGLGDQPTQKNFEGMLWQRLQAFGAHPVFIEAESRKVGRITLPDLIMRKIEIGERLLVEGTIAARVERLLALYMPQKNEQSVRDASGILEALTDRLGKQTIADLKAQARTGNFELLVKNLLELYYDPHYDKHIAKNRPFALELTTDDPASAAAKIMEWCKQKTSKIMG